MITRNKNLFHNELSSCKPSLAFPEGRVLSVLVKPGGVGALLRNVLEASLILAMLSCCCHVSHVRVMGHPSSINKHQDTQLVVVL